MSNFGNIDDKTFNTYVERVGDEVKSKTYLTKATKRMDIIANYAIAQTKALTPVGKKNGGTLRRSWKRSNVNYTDKSLVVKVSNSADYASFVENGHRTRSGGWVNGRFMLKQGLELTEQNKLNQTAQKELDGYISKLLGG